MELHFTQVHLYLQSILIKKINWFIIRVQLHFWRSGLWSVTFEWRGERVILHYYSSGQQYFGTLFLFPLSLWGCCLSFNCVFYCLVCLHEDSCLRRGKAGRSTCCGESVNLWSAVGSVWVHLSRIGFTWCDESVSAHPGLVFVQPIKPGCSCFGFTELSSVTYPGYLDLSFVQRSPGTTSGKSDNIAGWESKE